MVQAVHDREATPLDATHLAWTMTVFVLVVLNWWVLFNWRTHDSWSASTFLVLILWAVSMYLMVVFLYPPRKDPEQGWGELYQDHRKWFLSAFLAQAGLDIWITSIRGDLFDPPAYLPFVVHYIVVVGVGLVVESARYHRFLSWYFVTTMLTWFLVVRRMLG